MDWLIVGLLVAILIGVVSLAVAFRDLAKAIVRFCDVVEPLTTR